MMHVASYTDGLCDPTIFVMPTNVPPMPRPVPQSSFSMMLRVMNDLPDFSEPSPTYRLSPRLRLFDRVRLFTGRLAAFGLETRPVLGNGVRLAA